MMAWLRRHLHCWFYTTHVPVRLPNGRVVMVALPADRRVYGWRVWRWTW